jgi:hypothetical protein
VVFEDQMVVFGGASDQSGLDSFPTTATNELAVLTRLPSGLFSWSRPQLLAGAAMPAARASHCGVAIGE